MSALLSSGVVSFRAHRRLTADKAKWGEGAFRDYLHQAEL